VRREREGERERGRETEREREREMSFFTPFFFFPFSVVEKHTNTIPPVCGFSIRGA
jgi:hypothetical protein